jgi:ubiquinone/menaquinone biosynthesis C-methylase UbiE
MLKDKEIVKILGIKNEERVLDVGGAMKQHDLIKIDTLVDMIRPEEAPYTASKLIAKNFVKVDITRDKLPFKDNEFDICLCTHTLEDLYNPFLVIGEMGRVAKRGLIVTPSMGQDMVFSHFDLTDWLTGPRRLPGQSHHKWFFINKGKTMQIIPKNYGILFSSRFQIVSFRGETEFIYLWKNTIKYKTIPDLNIHKLIDLYENYIDENKEKLKFGRVLFYWDNPFYLIKAHLKLLFKKGEGFRYRKIIK